MASTIGQTGLLSSNDADTSKDLYHLLNTSTASYSATITQSAGIYPVTPFNATAPVASVNVAGLNSWRGTFNGRYPNATAGVGHQGLITYSSGYVLGATGFSLNLSAESYQDTALASTPPTDEAYIPGLISCTGTFDVRIDGTTATSPAGTSGSATFRLTTDTSDNELSGTIIVSEVVQEVKIGAKNVGRYSFTFTGNITSAGTNTLFPAGTLTTPDATDILLDVNGTTDYSGSAFWTGLAITVQIGSPIEVSGTLQGTGALTRGS